MPNETFEVETYTINVRGITNTNVPRRISIHNNNSQSSTLVAKLGGVICRTVVFF